MNQFHNNIYDEKYSKTFSREMFSGIIAGLLNVIVGQPLDTIRIRKQSEIKKIPIYEHIRRAVKNEGPLSLFRGMSSYIFFLPLYVALNFTSFTFFKKILNMNERSEKPEFGKLYLAGCLSGVFSCIIGTPMELYTVIMQIDRQQIDKKLITNNKFLSYNSSFEVAQDIQRNIGFKGHYRGFPAMLLRNIHGYGSYYLVYYFTKYTLFKYHYKESDPSYIKNIMILFSGSLAGIAGWVSTYPFDVIKTKLFQDNEKKLYKGIVDCVKISRQIHGDYRFLFNGMGTTILKCVPVYAATFFGYEYGQQFFNRLF